MYKINIELEQCSSNINLTNWTSETDESSDTIYTLTNCISGDFIYRITDENTCHSKLTSGVHVFVPVKFKISGEVKIKNIEIDPTSDNTINHEEVLSGSIYICSTLGCTETTGYIKIKAVYILTTEEPTDWENEYKNKYYTAGVGKKQFIQNDTFDSDNWTKGFIYRKEEEVFYSVNKDGSISKIDKDTNELCHKNSIGKLDSNGSVCLGMNPSGSSVSLAFASGNDLEYILTNPSSDSIFSISTGNDGIILKQTPNVIYHDISQSGKLNFIIIIFFKLIILKNFLKDFLLIIKCFSLPIYKFIY